MKIKKKIERRGVSMKMYTIAVCYYYFLIYEACIIVICTPQNVIQVKFSLCLTFTIYANWIVTLFIQYFQTNF